MSSLAKFEEEKKDYYFRGVCPSVPPSLRPSVRMKELGSQRKEFRNIWLIIFEYLSRKLQAR